MSFEEFKQKSEKVVDTDLLKQISGGNESSCHCYVVTCTQPVFHWKIQCN